MAKEITEKPAEFCFPDCPFMQLTVNNHVAYADGIPCLTTNTLVCAHEDACKMWAEKSDLKIKKANWVIWGGWCGNHDQRIERATCSECGYVHPTVYGSLDKLSKTCPNCKNKMGVVER